MPSGRRSWEDMLPEKIDRARADAWDVYFRMVGKTLYQAMCPKCKHKFKTKQLEATPAQVSAAAKFILEHSEGRAPARTAVDPNKRDVGQITQVVSHDIEDTEEDE